MVRVEIASANDTKRRDTTKHTPRWEVVAEGANEAQALRALLEQANDEAFDISNSWLRLVTENGVETF